LIGQADGNCPGLVDGKNGNQIGSPASPLDPHLGALADNGGPTPTVALLLGSPAINAGDAADCQAASVSGIDQRGKGRATASRGACDVGAYDTGVKPLETLSVKRLAGP